jgi:hypothetical protein
MDEWIDLVSLLAVLATVHFGYLRWRDTPRDRGKRRNAEDEE